MFRVSHAGAKGFGVFATRPIARGTRILAEKPLLSITNKDPSVLAVASRLSHGDRQRLLSLSTNDAKRESLLRLAAAAWESFPSLTSITQNRELLNIFYNNNFSIAGSSGERAIFLTVARINHSCVPNAQGNVNTALPGGSQFTIHALRAIAGGEEITISYLHDELAIRSVRQQRLKEGYGFECACEICSTVDLGESHQRRLNIRKTMAGFSEHHVGPDAAIRELFLTKALIETYELEGLSGRELGSLYFAAASLATKLGHGKEASVLGAKGLQIEEDTVGLDSPLYAASLSALKNGHYERNRLTSDLSTPPTDSPGLSYEPWM
ncbi:SET domain-containing protein 5 [Diaporthe australafricana]|uniref:SET domain-containing protein 5 n=1 Tax=Diaporthe australafricana TaxID=127596 RepID=A0ABR3VZN5_9PEZI